MSILKVQAVRSDGIYRKIMEAPASKKNDIYRYEMMKPFEKKWACYNVPMKAAQPNGYDVIMASGMLGFLLPEKIDETWAQSITLLDDNQFWDNCQKSIERSLKCFSDAGIEFPVKEYLYTVLLADPQNPYSIMNDNYCGDGGIPGYIFTWLVPSEHTKSRLPVALAHETNHNVRFQFIKWHNDITLAEMMISEGLAENFATYLYGDEMAQMQNYFPVGLPYCAGYACGYHMIKYYLKKTGKSIIEATMTPADEILKEVEGFWNES